MIHPDRLADGAIERLFDDLAQAVDRAGPQQETLFLAKLVLLMVEDIGDPERVAALITQAQAPLDA